jgi:hypothetical protein
MIALGRLVFGIVPGKRCLIAQQESDAGAIYSPSRPVFCLGQVGFAYFFFGLEAILSAALTCIVQSLRPSTAFLVQRYG